MADGNKTITDYVMEAEEKDTPKLLLRIALNLESTSRSIEEINKQFEGIGKRLREGDATITAIQMKIERLPCKTKTNSFVCSTPNSWSKTKITAIGSAIATAVVVIIETVKRLV